MYGLGTDAVPDDAFFAAYIGGGKYGFKITVLYPDGSPASGIPIRGLTTISGGALSTDANGKCLGISTTATVTITAFADYLDLQPYSNTLTVSGAINSLTITPQKQAYTAKTFNTSAALNMSPMVADFDVAASVPAAAVVANTEAQAAT